MLVEEPIAAKQPLQLHTRNLKTPSTSKTKRANQQRRNIAEYLIFLFFITFSFEFHDSQRADSKYHLLIVLRV